MGVKRKVSFEGAWQESLFRSFGFVVVDDEFGCGFGDLVADAEFFDFPLSIDFLKAGNFECFDAPAVGVVGFGVN